MGKRDPTCSAWSQGREVGTKDRGFNNTYFSTQWTGLSSQGVPKKVEGESQMITSHLEVLIDHQSLGALTDH